MRSRTGSKGAPAPAVFSPIKESPPADKPAEWEVRPNGMLVQKRGPDAAADAAAAVVPTIRVKVKHGAVCHEIYISAQASFGELKKELSAKTGLHPLDMKLMYKGKVRESTAFLDTAGVKDKSKVVVEEDPTARAKRLLELRKTEKMERAAKSISAISVEVDRLASKVSALEAIVNKGGKVVENDVTNLTDSLMNELIKLDAIVADGDAKLQRRMQIKRVQRYVETLDAIKIKKSTPRTNGQLSQQPPQFPLQNNKQNQHQMQEKRNLQRSHHQFQQTRDLQHQKQDHRQKQLPKQQTNRQLQQQPQPPVVVTTNWETFDSLFAPPTSTPTTATSTASSTPHASFDWELF
ncbi:BAG family molecular chaperone regulator 1-like [Canna indica]|uniref:BAG family molecular chaperone regulator 1-like n=1 Tax=Canna indica TaxID=4628 RepID=A0AAQ3Q3Z0_9LILI|nr:BAG family molecular chaperone regulator 1-like [Canna indica]